MNDLALGLGPNLRALGVISLNCAVMPERRSDEALMIAFAEGQTAAFDALYARHRAPLFRYVKRLCRHHETARELYQDIWMRIIEKRGNYRPQAKFSTYLYTVAHNRVVDHFRRQRVRGDVTIPPEYVDEIAGDAAEPGAELDAIDTAKRILAVLDGLPDEQREAFLLKEEGGMSVGEIAAATGVGPETAKSRLRYAFAKIRKVLDEHS